MLQLYRVESRRTGKDCLKLSSFCWQAHDVLINPRVEHARKLKEANKNEAGNLVKERKRKKEHNYYFNTGSGNESEHYQCPHLRFSLHMKESSTAATDCISATFRITCGLGLFPHIDKLNIGTFF